MPGLGCPVAVGIGTVEMFGTSFAFSKLTLVAEFLVMAAVLVVRPWGLFGRPQSPSRHAGPPETPLARAGRRTRLAAGARQSI